MGRAFWLGLIGLIFGILGGVFAGLMGGIGELSNLYSNAAGAISFSLIGMAGAVLENRK
jgi:hypothetical protein